MDPKRREELRSSEGGTSWLVSIGPRVLRILYDQGGSNDAIRDPITLRDGRDSKQALHGECTFGKSHEYRGSFPAISILNKVA